MIVTTRNAGQINNGSGGLSLTPGRNTAQGYQDLSGQNLNNVWDVANRESDLGSGLQRDGQNRMRQWDGNSAGMYGMAAGLAGKAPSWYADRAGVTSNQAFDESKGVQERTLSRMGINPNSGRFVGMQQQWGLARAAAEAGAKTRASQDAEATQFQRQAELSKMASENSAHGLAVANIGSGMIHNAANEYAGLANTYDKTAGDVAQNTRDRVAASNAQSMQARQMAQSQQQQADLQAELEKSRQDQEDAQKKNANQAEFDKMHAASAAFMNSAVPKSTQRFNPYANLGYGRTV